MQNTRNAFTDILTVFPDAIGLERGDAARLMADYAAADCTAKEYCRRIGKGNLRSYLDTLAAGERADARRNTK